MTQVFNRFLAKSANIFCRQAVQSTTNENIWKKSIV